MSIYAKMANKEVEKIKYNLKQVYNDSLELHSQMLKKEKLMKNSVALKKSWEYATYLYIKSMSYERKKKYKKIYNITCELETLILENIN